MILYFSTWLRNILTYEKYSYTSGIFLYPMKYALVLFHYCPAVCMMVGWGRLATHNSRAALSSIYQIYRNISISTQLTQILSKWTKLPVSQEQWHRWLYLNHSVFCPTTTIGPTVIHWLIVNGVTVGRPECDHNGPTINIWWAAGGYTTVSGKGAYFTNPDHPPWPFVTNFHFVKDRKFEIEARNCSLVKSFSPPLGSSASQGRDMSGGEVVDV